MKNTSSSSINRNSNKGRIISEMKLEGPLQMAIDVLLLNQAISNGGFSVTMRFYSWEGNWLSIGRNQNNIPNHWIDLIHKKQLKVVRRPSGGKSVLHSGGLTYALIWDEPPRSKRESYIKANQWLIEGFSKLNLALKLGGQSGLDIPKNCFATSTIADLIDNKGQKRIGSAQFWKKGSLLQHGEILLNPSQSLWEYIFNESPPNLIKIDFPKEKIKEALIKSLKQTWTNIDWQNTSLSEGELNQAIVISENFHNDLKPA